MDKDEFIKLAQAVAASMKRRSGQLLRCYRHIGRLHTMNRTTDLPDFSETLISRKMAPARRGAHAVSYTHLTLPTKRIV